jgi:peptidoglycan/xylan/chitin deacetylase (PgdA/CDA1 family)
MLAQRMCNAGTADRPGYAWPRAGRSIVRAASPSEFGAVTTRGLSTLPYRAKAGATRVRSAVWLARARGRTDESGLRILLYHRVADDGDPLAVPPRRFREQMDHLASEGFTVVGLLEALALLDSATIPPRTVGLTFDDGFADLRDEALPALKAHGFRATVFVSTGVTDGRMAFPWYERQPPVLPWDDVLELDREGTLRFEAHTVSHPNLLSVDEATAAAEIEDSRRELELRLERPVSAFAYPAGLFGKRERRLVAAAGYAAAVSCEPGVNGPDTDRFALRRRQVDARDTLLDFRAKVGGGHDTPPPLRAAYRRLRYGMRPRPASSRA